MNGVAKITLNQNKMKATLKRYKELLKIYYDVTFLHLKLVISRGEIAMQGLSTEVIDQDIARVEKLVEKANASAELRECKQTMKSLSDGKCSEAVDACLEVKMWLDHEAISYFQSRRADMVSRFEEDLQKHAQMFTNSNHPLRTQLHDDIFSDVTTSVMVKDEVP